MPGNMTETLGMPLIRLLPGSFSRYGRKDSLLVKVVLEGMEFVFAQHTSFPPGYEESCAIAEELNERRGDASQTYREAAVADSGVDEDE